MRKGTVALAVCVSLLSGAGAALCHVRSEALQRDASWLLERGNAQAQEYAEKLDGSFADAELKTLAQRRAVMEQAHVWRRWEMLAIMAAALALVVGYGLFLLRRLEEQLADAMPEYRDVPAASPEPARALAPSPAVHR